MDLRQCMVEAAPAQCKGLGYLPNFGGLGGTRGLCCRVCMSYCQYEAYHGIIKDGHRATLGSFYQNLCPLITMGNIDCSSYSDHMGLCRGSIWIIKGYRGYIGFRDAGSEVQGLCADHCFWTTHSTLNPRGYALYLVYRVEGRACSKI